MSNGPTPSFRAYARRFFYGRARDLRFRRQGRPAPVLRQPVVRVRSSTTGLYFFFVIFYFNMHFYLFMSSRRCHGTLRVYVRAPVVSTSETSGRSSSLLIRGKYVITAAAAAAAVSVVIISFRVRAQNLTRRHRVFPVMCLFPFAPPSYRIACPPPTTQTHGKVILYLRAPCAGMPLSFASASRPFPHFNQRFRPSLVR